MGSSTGSIVTVFGGGVTPRVTLPAQAARGGT